MDIDVQAEGIGRNTPGSKAKNNLEIETILISGSRTNAPPGYEA